MPRTDVFGNWKAPRPDPRWQEVLDVWQAEDAVREFREQTREIGRPDSSDSSDSPEPCDAEPRYESQCVDCERIIQRGLRCDACRDEMDRLIDQTEGGKTVSDVFEVFDPATGGFVAAPADQPVEPEHEQYEPHEPHEQHQEQQEPQERAKPQIEADTASSPVPADQDAKARLATLTAKDSLYWKTFGLTEDEHRQREAVLLEVQNLHRVLAGEQAQAERATLPPEEQPTDLLPNTPADWSQDNERAFREIAREIQAPPALVTEIAQAVLEAGPEGYYDDPGAAMAALVGAEGENDANVLITHARIAVAEAGPELVAWLDQTGYGNSLPVIRQAARIGQQILEAREELEEARKNPAYLDSGHHMHREMVAEVERLTRLAHPFQRAR